MFEPSQISIPSNIQRVSLSPGAAIPDPPGTFDSIQNADLKPEYNYNRAKRSYMEGLYEIMRQSSRFRKVVLRDSGFKNLYKTGVLTWDELRQVCSHDSTDAVLLLKKAESTILPFYSDNITKLRIINVTKWTFYEPFTEKVDYELKMNDTCYIDHEINPRNTKIITGDIPALLYDACYYSGMKLGNQICFVRNDHPQRILYSGPGKPLKHAYYLAKHNQWHQAAAIWHELSKSLNVKEASRASFNQALAWEQDDDIEQAFLWISYSDSLRRSKKSIAYKEILEQRLKKKEVLDNQVTGK